MSIDRRPDISTGLLWRAVAPLAALGCLLADAPDRLTGALALAGLGLAAERLAALRRTGLADRLLVGVGGVLVALVLTGPALDAAGIGLHPATWAGAAIGLGLLGLLVALVVPARPAAARTDADADADADADPTAARWTAVRALPWVAAAVLVTVLAVRMSATSLSTADEPPLQMSFGDVSGTDVEVVISSTDALGPLELRTSSGGTEISYPLITLARDGSSTTTVAVPRTGRFVITLSYPDQTEPLRRLVLDR